MPLNTRTPQVQPYIIAHLSHIIMSVVPHLSGVGEAMEFATQLMA